MVTVPFNAILDETAGNQLVMPVESAQCSTEPPVPKRAEIRLPVTPADKSNLPCLQPSVVDEDQGELSDDKASPSLVASTNAEDYAQPTTVHVGTSEDYAQPTTVHVSTSDDCAQPINVHVVIKEAETVQSVTPIALYRNPENLDMVIDEPSGSFSVEKEGSTKDQLSSDLSRSNTKGNLKEHDYLADKHVEPTSKEALPPLPVSRRSKRKAAMSPRRWCHAGCCDDGRTHGKSKEAKTEATGRKGKSPKREKVVKDEKENMKECEETATAVKTIEKSLAKIDEEIDIHGETEQDKEASTSILESENVDPATAENTDNLVDPIEAKPKTTANVTKKTNGQKSEQDSFTITPDGIDPDEEVPINIIKATKPDDLKTVDTDGVGINTRFECVCGQKFTQKKSLIRHFRRKKARPDGLAEAGSHHFSKYPIAIYPNTKAPRKKPPPKNFPCPYCDKVLQTKAGMDYHLMSHTGHKPVLCSLCGAAFKSKQLLDQHFVIHTNTSELPHKCDVCGRTYLTATRLRAHKKTHGEKIYQCEFCAHKFVMSKDLKKHMRVHTGEKPFSCDFCDERFHFSQDVKRHLKRFHLDKAPFNCPVCVKNNAFFKQEEFDMHMKIHGDSDYRCEICMQNFPSYTTFRNHQVMHSSKNPFTCRYDNCSQEFRCANDRYVHERKVHDTNLMYCQFCKVSFKRQSAYEEHTKKHMESSYECRVDPECDMRFQQPYARLRHEKSHGKAEAEEIRKKRIKKEKPCKPQIVPNPATVYQCGVCWKTYKNYQSLRDHVREHGQDYHYTCRVVGCDMRFKRVYHRRKHEQSHSTDEIINSVLDTRLRANEESIDSSEEEGAVADEETAENNEVVGQLSAELAAQALAANVNTETEVVVASTSAETADFEETEIAVQFVLHWSFWFSNPKAVMINHWHVEKIVSIVKSIVFIPVAAHVPIGARPSYFEVINYKIIKHLPRFIKLK